MSAAPEPSAQSACLKTSIFSSDISSIVGRIPPMPYPDWRRPANGIQSARKAVWSLIMTAEASSRWAARKAGPISVEKTLAWKAKGRELAISMASSRILEAVDACHGAEDLQL